MNRSINYKYYQRSVLIYGLVRLSTTEFSSNVNALTTPGGQHPSSAT